MIKYVDRIVEKEVIKEVEVFTEVEVEVPRPFERIREVYVDRPQQVRSKAKGWLWRVMHPTPIHLARGSEVARVGARGSEGGVRPYSVLHPLALLHRPTRRWPLVPAGVAT